MDDSTSQIHTDDLNSRIWLKPAEVARLLYVRDVDIVYQFIKDGHLQAVNVSSGAGRPTWRISRAEVERFRFDRTAGLRGYVKA
jgi:hypothetical protein